MIRTVIGILLIGGAIVCLPVWVQFGLLILGVVLLPYRLALFIPAAFADALYAPGQGSIFYLKYTLVTAVVLLLYWTIATKTRIGELYAMETK